MHPFRAAVEAWDHDAIHELLADDVVFNSPVVFKPYHGRDTVAVLLRAVSQVFEDFRYEREIGSGDDHALVFRARVGDRELQGVDLIHDRDGKIAELTVMIRPRSGAQALAEAMQRQLELATQSQSQSAPGSS
jgi:hypothetical protein